jgi:hypothetical protein
MLDSWHVSGQSRHGLANLAQLPLIHSVVGNTLTLLDLSPNTLKALRLLVLGIGCGTRRNPSRMLPLYHFAASGFHRLE